MAMSNKQKRYTLMKEINNLVALLVKVDAGSEPMDTLTEQKQKVLDLLPVTPPDKRGERCTVSESYPMHRLLSCRPLIHTEIPLDVLEKLVASGFDVNSRDDISGPGFESFEDTCTCLNYAIRNQHYAAVRWLVQHGGADCDICSMENIVILRGEDEYDSDEDNYDEVDDYDSGPATEYMKTMPLGTLASKANAPLDLFDLLVTPKSLNHNKPSLPLDIALNVGHTDGALRLLKLGSPTENGKLLRIWCYMNKCYKDSLQYHDELFTRLLLTNTDELLLCIHHVLLQKDRERVNAGKAENDVNDREEENEENNRDDENEEKKKEEENDREEENEEKKKEEENDREEETEENNRDDENEENNIDDENEEKKQEEENDREEETEENKREEMPRNDSKLDAKYKILNRLFQYIMPSDQMCICFEKQHTSTGQCIYIKLNSMPFAQNYSVHTVYWWSLLLVNLGWNIKSTPQSIVPLLFDSATKEDVQLAHRIDDLWMTYRDTCRSAISLKNLSIQQTRRSMRDFSEDSFMSLPVPNKLRKLLMYQHVAEKACEAVL